MKSRTVVELMPDGHIAVTTLSRIEGGGNAHDRKVRKTREIHGEGPAPKWRRDDRRIFRTGVKQLVQVAPNITLLPFGSEEMNEQAENNELLADDATCEAYERVQEINNNALVFDSDPRRCFMPKVKKVVIVYEGGMVEEL